MPFKVFFLKCCKPEKKILDQRQTNWQKIVSDDSNVFFDPFWKQSSIVLNSLHSNSVFDWLQSGIACFMLFMEEKNCWLSMQSETIIWTKDVHEEKFWKTSGRNSETFKIRFNSRSIIESTKLAVIKQTPSSQHVIKQHFE